MAEKLKYFQKNQTESLRYDSDDVDHFKKYIQVACRLRSLSQKEKEISEKSVIDISPDLKTISLKSQYDSSNQLSFTFDLIFPPDSCQKEVYEEIGKPIIVSVLEGFNGTILTYGQTSSGKTYTMVGPDINDPIQKGLIPRIVYTIFQSIKEADTMLEFAVKVAYCEIYLEKIRDLLFPGKKNLKISEDRTRGVYIKELTEEYVCSEAEVFSLLKLGNKNREVASTLMNEESSRSHAIFMITITQSNTSDFSSKTGKLYLVDLAGSEKLSKTGAEGKRLDETKNINKSLSTLGNVIFSLTDGKSTHIPYRDSKLTRVLQDSLGGNSKTSLIITVSPAAYNEHESISTLRFGIRAKAVTNKPKINKELSIAQLKLLLEQANECILTKNSKIVSLEKQILLIGGNLSKDYTDEACIYTELDPPGKYSNILYTLNNEKEHFQNKIEESEEAKKEKALKNAQIKNLTKENDNLNERIAYLMNASQEYEEKMQDLIDNCNKLQAKNESQEKQILCLLDTNRNLDKKIEEMQEIINYSKTEARLLQEHMNLLQSKDTLQREFIQISDNNIERFLEENKKLLKEIPEKFHAIHDFIEKKLENLITQRHNKSIDFKNSLEDIEKFEKYLEKGEFENDENMSYTQAQNYVEKVYSLEKNLEQLNLMYQISLNKYSTIRTDIGIYEKKINRKNDRILMLEKKFKKATEQINSYKYKLELSMNDMSELSILTDNYPKIKKMIKGGNNRVTNILCPYSINT